MHHLTGTPEHQRVTVYTGVHTAAEPVWRVIHQTNYIIREINDMQGKPKLPRGFHCRLRVIERAVEYYQFHSYILLRQNTDGQLTVKSA
jgi:hypothetical protein